MKLRHYAGVYPHDYLYRGQLVCGWHYRSGHLCGGIPDLLVHKTERCVWCTEYDYAHTLKKDCLSIMESRCFVYR